VILFDKQIDIGAVRSFDLKDAEADDSRGLSRRLGLRGGCR